MTKKQFYRELARRSKKRVPNMRSMTFTDLADLNESYINRCLDEREAERAITSKRRTDALDTPPRSERAG